MVLHFSLYVFCFSEILYTLHEIRNKTALHIKIKKPDKSGSSGEIRDTKPCPLSVLYPSWVFAFFDSCYFPVSSLMSAAAELGIEQDINYYSQ